MRDRKLLTVSLALVSLCVAPQPVASSQTEPAPPLDPAQSRGKAVYLHHCAACHGANGDGAGPASVWLFPRPRNFSAGLFKIKSTPGTALPTDADLFNTVTRGMPGSSMPSFTYLTDQQRRDAVHYVNYLTAAT